MFTVREYLGPEIHKFDPDQPPGQGLAPIRKDDELKPGDQILVPGIGDELILMTVERDEYGVLHGKAGELMAVLEFSNDDREAWVCTGLVNLKGLDRLKIGQ